MMVITIKETKPGSDWYGNTNMGRPATMLLIHHNDKVYKYECFSILFSFYHIQAQPQIAWGKFVFW